MIGATVKICGEILSDENLFIEGEVEGSITLNEHELTVGPSGRIYANIQAQSIRIEGEVDGDIIGREKVLITKSGNVRGNIIAPRVILEDGGKFKGSIDMGPSLSTSIDKPRAEVASAASKMVKPTPEVVPNEIQPAIKRV